MDAPISIKDYHIHDVDKLPKLFFGFRIKDKFDEARLKIKTKYCPKYLVHFRYTTQLEPIFLYGIDIKPKPQYSSLLKTLCQGDMVIDSKTFGELYSNYKHKLSEYDLTCDECYRYTYDGIYPIDSKHLPVISQKDYTQEAANGFTNMVNRSNVPWYLSLANFNLYILCKCMDYDF